MYIGVWNKKFERENLCKLVDNFESALYQMASLK